MLMLPVRSVLSCLIIEETTWTVCIYIYFLLLFLSQEYRLVEAAVEDNP